MPSSGNLHYFWLRRLHSLLGLAPIGVFLLEHFWSNSHVFHGPAAYDKMVADLWAMPLLIWLEVGLIFLPILFHVALGLVITYTAANNFIQYGYYRNWMYFFQRVTGILALGFVAYHVWTTRVAVAMADRLITFRDMQVQLQPAWAQWVYGIGIVAVCFHFANGIATSLITWGITVSPKSQRAASVACWIFFVAMSAWGLQILWEFM
ncbi:MAG: succinate dehydrogenase [Deltaproteobacteria bacterium]|nr:succinate dehydrogenase [Deltaproteobacteria bacterium]